MSHEILNDRVHDIKHHPFKRRERYELHSIDAVFTGFKEDTIELEIITACSPIAVGTSIVESRKLKKMLDSTINEIFKVDEKDRKPSEVILIRRTKKGNIQPIVADLKGGKGRVQRLARIEKRIKEIADEYGKAENDKLEYIKVERGKKSNGKH